MTRRPTILMILDGFGLSDRVEGNAIIAANTPNLDKLMTEYPYAKCSASGLAVGLPEGQMGNSEVGHLNMGAGRVVYQSLTRITKSIKDGDFFEKEELLIAIDNCKNNNSSLHIYGLVSDGGVHSEEEHLYATLELARRHDLKKVYVHAFLDGRDTPPNSAKKYLEKLENKINEIGVGKIATITGRYYAMDRDNRWERVEKAYNAMVMGDGAKANSASEAIILSYQANILDEFVVPTIIMENDKPIATINENDSIICFNFRPDRAREITKAFCDESFGDFTRNKGFMKLVYVCFTEYDINIENKLVVYKPENIENTLAEYLAKKGLKQFHTAETEKYAHVTFFFNGGIEEPYHGEDRLVISSPKVATYDLMPEMSAYEVTDKLIEAINSDKYDFIVINYANCDMVGHSGIMEATVKAVEAVDECVGRVYDTVLQKGSQMLICADHGNAEEMIYPDGKPYTAHTTNFVPLILVNFEKNAIIREDGKLCDIAPTILEMMGLPKPIEMNGESLIKLKGER
ncbi:MAG TPA: 2,3-bisphosphoglycerate-independent phosphoglycerate mutase [Clostridiales bacterium]|nr:MAG: phosphoglycerate mutase (2,3-diphosphoglycerate-independent) [Clostridiales bacterium GWD2_32_59]HAN09416.1 2,3-bisphosphoglycerate-independent phosphoglycerate mutase [Clostridiales bacterium]